MVLNDFYGNLTEEERMIFSEIESAALQLGYKPKRAKTQDVNYVFTNRKTIRHIMKFSLEKGKPILKLKFFASQDYSRVFHEGVRFVIEEYNYKYTGCYGCGKCKARLEGYIYKYEDGRTYFRCGGELISLPGITLHDVPEIINLLQTQHEYFLQSTQRSS